MPPRRAAALPPAARQGGPIPKSRPRPETSAHGHLQGIRNLSDRRQRRIAFVVLKQRHAGNRAISALRGIALHDALALAKPTNRASHVLEDFWRGAPAPSTHCSTLPEFQRPRPSAEREISKYRQRFAKGAENPRTLWTRGWRRQCLEVDSFAKPARSRFIGKRCKMGTTPVLHQQSKCRWKRFSVRESRRIRRRSR